MRHYLIIVALIALGALIGLHAEEIAAAPVAAVDPADTATQIATWIAGILPPKYLVIYAAIIALCTALGLVLTAVAAVLRKVVGEDSPAAAVLDTIAHWASAIGTSTRKSQILPAPKV